MSFVKVGTKNAEYISLVLRPNVHVVSSSVGGEVLGSQHVSPIRSVSLILIALAEHSY